MEDVDKIDQIFNILSNDQIINIPRNTTERIKKIFNTINLLNVCACEEMISYLNDDASSSSSGEPILPFNYNLDDTKNNEVNDDEDNDETNEVNEEVYEEDD